MYAADEQNRTRQYSAAAAATTALVTAAKGAQYAFYQARAGSV